MFRSAAILIAGAVSDALGSTRPLHAIMDEGRKAVAEMYSSDSGSLALELPFPALFLAVSADLFFTSPRHTILCARFGVEPQSSFLGFLGFGVEGFVHVQAPAPFCERTCRRDNVLVRNMSRARNCPRSNLARNKCSACRAAGMMEKKKRKRKEKVRK